MPKEEVERKKIKEGFGTLKGAGPFTAEDELKTNEDAALKDFPDFMKTPKNKVPNKDQYSHDIEGYYYQANDGSQMAFWTCHTEGTSKTHTHPYDEYVACIQGKYTVIIDNQETDLKPGDEFHIPKETEHSCRRTAGTRTIHAFGGKRIQKTQ